MKSIIERQQSISCGEGPTLPLPKYSSYAVCNMRGGIGKTSLTFNLSYLTDNILAVDTCPQCSLSEFYDENYTSNAQKNALNLIEPYLYPNMGQATHVACKIAATNISFEDKNSYYIGSSEELYALPSVMTQALSMAGMRRPRDVDQSIEQIVTSLRTELDREQRELGIQKRIIDTSPFLAGMTLLSWFAADALIIPVRTDRQSISSLKLLINTMKSNTSDFNRHRGAISPPKIQAVILTHCGWSTSAGARNIPNKQTQIYLQEMFDIVYKNISLFSTDDPSNHIFILDDFLGSGRISSALRKPIELLQRGETHTINRVKTEVNTSVEKIKNELKHISSHLWME